MKLIQKTKRSKFLKMNSNKQIIESLKETFCLKLRNITSTLEKKYKYRTQHNIKLSMCHQKYVRNYKKYNKKYFIRIQQYKIRKRNGLIMTKD